MADICFIVAVARVIARVEERLKEQDLATYLPTLDAKGMFGLQDDDLPMVTRLPSPFFVDDYAIPIMALAAACHAKSVAALTVFGIPFVNFRWNEIWRLGKRHSCLSFGARVASPSRS